MKFNKISVFFSLILTLIYSNAVFADQNPVNSNNSEVSAVNKSIG